MGKYDPAKYAVDLNECPSIVTDTLPGPKSNELHARATKYFRGLSGQVRLFPVAFESGNLCTMTDADGNKYIDFSSGIYVTGLGHAHPKISEAIAQAAKKLMNAHDFTTEIKVQLLEKMHEVLPGDLTGMQLYDSGTTAVEAALRTCRAATGNHEFLSCFGDFHGKSGHSISLARMNKFSGPARSPGFYMVPRPDTYRPWWTREDGSLDTEKYLEFYDTFILESTTGRVAAFVLEPIQGLGGEASCRPTTSSPNSRSSAKSGISSSWPTRSFAAWAGPASGFAWRTGTSFRTSSRSARDSATASR